jgi:hypothetical protein
MSMTRLITLPVHSAIEILLGSAIVAAPFAFGFGAAGLVTAFVIGTVVIGLGIAASGSGRGSLPVAAHHAYDGGIALGLVGAAVLLGLSGDGRALLVLAVAGILQLALSATTRYSAPAGA